MDLEDWITVGAVFGANLFIGIAFVTALGALVARYL